MKKSRIVVGLPTKMKNLMKTRFTSQVILFLATSKYRNVTFICYGWQQAIYLFFRILVFQTWATTQAIINMFLPVVKLCVLIQNASYWLLSNAFHSTFTLCIAMKVNVTRA